MGFSFFPSDIIVLIKSKKKTAAALPSPEARISEQLPLSYQGSWQICLSLKMKFFFINLHTTLSIWSGQGNGKGSQVLEFVISSGIFKRPWGSLPFLHLHFHLALHSKNKRLSVYTEVPMAEIPTVINWVYF